MVKKDKQNEFGQKTKAVDHKKYYEEHVSAGTIAKEYSADKGMLCSVIRSYNQYGESAMLFER